MLVLVGLLALSACSSDVEIDAEKMSEADTAACADLLDALPDTLFGDARRPVSPPAAPGAAWGDGDPVVLTCGATLPVEYDDYSACIEFGGVGWFASDADQKDLTGPATLTALTVTPRVSLVVPAQHRRAGVDGALTELAEPISSTLNAAKPCH